MTPLWLLLAATASGAEYRHFVISPGLELDTELLATESLGFRVRIAQGELIIPFDRVDGMTTIDHAERQPWTVVLVSEGAERELVQQALVTVPAVQVIAPGEVPDGDERLKVLSCGRSLPCLTAAREPGTWTFFVVSGLVDGAVSLGGLPAFRTEAGAATAPLTDPVAFHAAVTQSLGLLAADAPPTSFVEGFSAWVRPLTRRSPHASAGTAWNDRRVAALAFAPIPGLPSAVRHDWKSFAGAWASTAALTAGWVVVAGTTSTSQNEQIGVSALGAYLSSVASSQLFGILGVRHRERLEAASRPVVLPVDALSPPDNVAAPAEAPVTP